MKMNYHFNLFYLKNKGNDVIVQAQSGTGKTALYLIAILQKLDLTLKECQVLVLAPGRELAQAVF